MQRRATAVPLYWRSRGTRKRSGDNQEEDIFPELRPLPSTGITRLHRYNGPPATPNGPASTHLDGKSQLIASVGPASAAATSERASVFPVDRYRNMAVIDHLLRLAADHHGREAATPMGSHHDHVGVA
jgi:hypothetical protein